MLVCLARGRANCSDGVRECCTLLMRGVGGCEVLVCTDSLVEDEGEEANDGLVDCWGKRSAGLSCKSPCRTHRCVGGGGAIEAVRL